MYLMGNMPEHSDWSRQVMYLNKLDEIKNIKDVHVEQFEIDLVTLHKQSVEDLKKRRLIEHKKIKIRELNESFGIKEDEEEIEKHVEIQKPQESEPVEKPHTLWEKLQGKGLTKKDGQ